LFDIVVPDSNSFIGDCFVNHNTGRLSSSKPNLQQIPKGNLIRNAFITDEKRLLAAFDFGRQELRILTHITKDPLLLDIYKNGKDVHAMTGTTIWNLQHPDQSVTYEYFQYCRSLIDHFCDKNGDIKLDKIYNDKDYIEQLFQKDTIKTTDSTIIEKDVINGKGMEKIRSKAKTINFGIIYGISSMKLSEDLSVSKEEAQSYIDSFFNTYKEVAKWMKETETQIRTKMYVESILGRKRRLYEEVRSGKKWMMGRALRMAGNFQIQGTAADMTKVACINLQPLLKELDSTIILFVHDEILVDIPENLGVENLDRIKKVMCEAIPLICGMTSDCEVAIKWGQKMSNDEIESYRYLDEEEEFDEESEENFDDD
jgi:DNA polymerase-1